MHNIQCERAYNVSFRPVFNYYTFYELRIENFLNCCSLLQVYCSISVEKVHLFSSENSFFDRFHISFNRYFLSFHFSIYIFSRMFCYCQLHAAQCIRTCSTMDFPSLKLQGGTFVRKVRQKTIFNYYYD